MTASLLLAQGQDRLGTIPDWLAAFGTLAAFGVALTLLAKELAERREYLEDRRRDQAGRVAAWPELEIQSGQPSRYVIVLRNGSEEPVYDVKVTLVAKDSPFASDPESVRNEDGSFKEAGPISLSEEILPPGEPVRYPIPSGLLPHAYTSPGLSFTDSRDRRWKRYPKGRLEEPGRSGPRSHKDYMNAWIVGELDRLDY